jgi:hypothetical protein
MNKLCFAIEDNVIKGISFDRNELNGLMYESTGRIQEVTVLDLARMFKTCGIQLGTDWLGISPVGHSFDIPKTSMDAWPDDGD